MEDFKLKNDHFHQNPLQMIIFHYYFENFIQKPLSDLINVQIENFCIQSTVFTSILNLSYFHSQATLIINKRILVHFPFIFELVFVIRFFSNF